jgi:hypothetical protein
MPPSSGKTVSSDDLRKWYGCGGELTDYSTGKIFQDKIFGGVVDVHAQVKYVSASKPSGARLVVYADVCGWNQFEQGLELELHIDDALAERLVRRQWVYVRGTVVGGRYGTLHLDPSEIRLKKASDGSGCFSVAVCLILSSSAILFWGLTWFL